MAASYDHEALVSLFRARETLAVELLAHLGFDLPDHTSVRTEDASLGVEPIEARADLVVVLESAGRPSLAIAVEVQLSRDRGKRRSWPLYAATLRFRHRCPSVVLVVSPDAPVARWASRPIPLGGGNTFRPTVLGPSSIPELPSSPVSPELALLSVKAHPESAAAGELAATSLAGLEPEALTLYSDVLFSWASPRIQELVMSKLMTSLPYPVSDFAKEHYGRGLEDGKAAGRREGEAKGRREGEAALILRLLARRFGALPEDVEARVREANADTLARWGDRVLDARTLDAVFEGP